MSLPSNVDSNSAHASSPKGCLGGSSPAGLDCRDFLCDVATHAPSRKGHSWLISISRQLGISSSKNRSCFSLGRIRLGAETILDAPLERTAATSQTVAAIRRNFMYRFSSLSMRDAEEEVKDTHRSARTIRLHGESPQFELSVPAWFGVSPQLQDIVYAWCNAATKAVADMSASLSDSPRVDSFSPYLPMLLAASGPATALAKALLMGTATGASGGILAPCALPVLISGFGGFAGFLQDSELAAGNALATHIGLFSLTSAVMFILSIRGLNKHSTSRQGNMLGMCATALGIISVMASPGFHGAHARFMLAFLLAGGAGYGVASQVKMEQMPQLVAGFHSFVGLAAVFAGFASYFGPESYTFAKALEMSIGTAIGMLTFTGSVVAAGKLDGLIPGKPIILDNRWALNLGGLGGSFILTSIFCHGNYHSVLGTICLLANTAIWGGLGMNLVLPIGGADMPVVVSLLNAFSGLATSAMGFMLSNNLLTITGALVASSGVLLSDIMCRGINRSMTNVLLGGFGVEDGSGHSAAAAAAGPITEVSAMGFVGVLLHARKICIVPGYGLAVARCQQRLAEIVQILRSHGVVVHFAIHPVAGRLPGHMNVLLAEVDVPYDIVREMDEIHANMHEYDVAIVVGANDIVNPGSQDDPSSPIYGMPAIEVWKCKTCVVLKRSMATGYSGVDNPLFYKENVQMFFGDARQSLDTVHHLLEDQAGQILGGSAPPTDAENAGGALSQEPEEFPAAVRVIGVIRERRERERRVGISPACVPALRRMGFSVLLEAGAGTPAGFTNDDYTKQGGVHVAESASEVLQQADIILKVNEPLIDEVQMLKSTQTLIGCWNLYGMEDLLEALAQSQASVLNLALVPRVSRAQKLDALTSMANIAGYRSVLDAFNHLPRFSRSSSTACGTIPPARIFVIGAGVAGLSAIATAHSLGAKVFANDVRDATAEQVRSLGAEFIPVDAQGISGEGAGGYATEMGEAFRMAQLATYARVIPDMDVVITTAMIPNRQAPILIPEDVVRSMRKGSVIVDLAAAAGGNCPLARADDIVVSPNGVTIIGETNYPSSMPAQASDMIGNNFIAMLSTLGGATDFGGEKWEDPIIRPATVAAHGEITWPPPTPPTPPPVPVPAAPQPTEGGDQDVPAATLNEAALPQMDSNSVVQWIEDHKHELALGVGAAVVLGLGLGADIPEREVTHLGYFVLSLLIGHFTVAGVTPALHTPLISVTNAISGVIVVGGMLQLSGPIMSARVACALAAVFLSSVNIVGGFAVTKRMLEMFREDVAKK